MTSKTREKAISHIKTLCGKAENVCLYDKYITRRGRERDNDHILRIIASLFPEKKMNISDHHDRYLIIDNKMEIILTGGFSTLLDTSKEFTYIVRPVVESRF